MAILMVARALCRLGIPSSVSGRNDILIDGKKFSGNAQYVKGNRIMHHGTLMFRSDMQVLSNVLTVSECKINSKGIKSVKSRVTNISNYIPVPMDLEEFKHHLLFNLFEDSLIVSYHLTPQDIAKVQHLKHKVYDTWSWNYGCSPNYDIRKSRRFENCGKLTLSMNVAHGIITDFTVYGDFFGLRDTSELALY